MPKGIVLHKERCLGCRSCEAVCSLVNAGEINPARSRISVITFLEGKYELPFHFIGSCRQCSDAPCLASCPAAAISRRADETGCVVVDPKCCIGCGKCVRACPFGAMKFDSEAKKAYKCELCDGAPACVAICPAGVLEYGEHQPVYASGFDYQMQGHLFLDTRNKESLLKRGKRKKTLNASGEGERG